MPSLILGIFILENMQEKNTNNKNNYIRTNINLTKKQFDYYTAKAILTGINKSELIRQDLQTIISNK